jgi:hypothetical protein
MSSEFKGQRSKSPDGMVARLCVTMCFLAAVLAAFPARTALGWIEPTHELITGEAVQRLPEPLRGLFAGEADLKRLQAASAEPDRRRDEMKKAVAAAPADQRAAVNKKYLDEKAKHYFDIDAITADPPPFAAFPRDRTDAVKQFGAEVFQEHGTAPWTAEDALAALADAFTRGATDDIFRAAGDLAHFAADIHTPFHVTKNFNGQLTGNEGIHKMFEIGLGVRCGDFYAAEIRKGRAEVPYLENVRDRCFDWIVQANARVQPILDADTAARRKTGYKRSDNREEAEKETEDPSSDRSRPYYAALKQELEARSSPDAAAMRDAADHLSSLFYTAWVRAGKPLSLAPAPAAQAAPAPTLPYWLIGLTVLLIILTLLPRRRPGPTPPQG